MIHDGRNRHYMYFALNLHVQYVCGVARHAHVQNASIIHVRMCTYTYTYMYSVLQNGCRDCHSTHDSPLNPEPTLAR